MIKKKYPTNKPELKNKQTYIIGKNKLEHAII